MAGFRLSLGSFVAAAVLAVTLSDAGARVRGERTDDEQIECGSIQDAFDAAAREYSWAISTFTSALLRAWLGSDEAKQLRERMKELVQQWEALCSGRFGNIAWLIRSPDDVDPLLDRMTAEMNAGSEAPSGLEAAPSSSGGNGPPIGISEAPSGGPVAPSSSGPVIN